MIWRLTLKDLKENYISSLVLLGVIAALSVYLSISRRLTQPEVAMMAFIIAGLGGSLAIFYSIYRGFSCLKREKDRNTLEFLMSLPTDGLEVVSAKFFAFFIEMVFFGLILFAISHFPVCKGIAQKVLSSQELGELSMLLLYIILGIVLVSLLLFLVFQLFEILNLSIKPKGFLWHVVLFIVYIYFTVKFFALLKSFFEFLPVKTYEIVIFNEVAKLSIDYQGLAAGVLVSLIYVSLSILIYNKKVEV